VLWVRYVQLTATSPTYGLVTVVIVDEPGQDRYYWLCRAIELISIYGILGLRRKEVTAMGALRFADLRMRPTEVLDLTSLTVNEVAP
jgi:hypothetical protein